MRLNRKHPLNQLALGYLRNPKRLRFSSEPVVPPDGHQDPYMEAGSPPDAVVRVWDVLGGSLPADCRAVVYGAPALVHPETGVLFALASGTAYRIRVPEESIEEAIGLGCETEREWTIGDRTNLEKELGRGWFYGRGAEEEKQWLATLYHALGNAEDGAG